MDRTVAEFAKKMKVSRKTVYTWVKMKGLPPGVTCRVHLRRLIIEDNREETKRPSINGPSIDDIIDIEDSVDFEKYAQDK